MKKTLTSLFIFFLVACVFIPNSYSANQEKDKTKKKMSEKNDPPKLEQRSFDQFFDHYFDDDFFGGRSSPFKQMEKMREQIKDLLKGFDNFHSDPFFDDWYDRKFGGSPGEIEQSEDMNFIYYKISLKNLKKGDVNINIKNGMIHITGSITKKEENQKDNSYYKSSIINRFERTIPTPPGVDEEKAEIEQKEGEVILKFPKRKITI